MKKIVICGGHLTPALALIDQLKKEKNLELIFFGRKFSTEGSENISAEFKEIEQQNIKFVNIKAGRLSRKLTRHALGSYAKIPLGFFLSFYYLLKVRPKLIISFGGYLSLPVVFCGWLLGIDSICHEQAITPGLANRINSLFSRKIYVSWQNSAKYFPKEKTEVVGNLTRRDIFQTKPQNPKIAAFLNKNPNYILVTGGNQGSHFINNLVFTNIKKLKDFSIFHILGTANYRGDHLKAKKIKFGNYFACDFVSTKDIGAVLNNASFLIARSGANTVWELAVLGIPAIFIPLPNSAGNEQLENAKILEKAGSATIIEQKNLSAGSLKDVIFTMQEKLNSYKSKAKDFSKTLPRNASNKLTAWICSNLKS